MRLAKPMALPVLSSRTLRFHSAQSSGESHMVLKPTLGLFALFMLVLGASSGCRGTDSSSPAGLSSAGQPAYSSPSTLPPATQQYAGGTPQPPSLGAPLANGYAPPVNYSQPLGANSVASENSVAGYSTQNSLAPALPASGSSSRANDPTSDSSSSCSSGCCSN